MNRNLQSSNLDERSSEGLVIVAQNPQSIATELSLRMERVTSAVKALDSAQRITQDSLQLEVSV